MEYDSTLIGKRISQERKKKELSQDKFLALLNDNYGYPMSRNTLSKIEQGKSSHFDCELFLIMCDIFDCEMGYLLGEYDCKTGRDTDITKETGLNSESITKLNSILARNGSTRRTDLLNLVINHPKFELLLALIGNKTDVRSGIISYGPTATVISSRMIINSDLKDTIIKIASDIREVFDHDYGAEFFYNLIYDLRNKGSITEMEYLDIKNHYDQGDFEYAPERFINKSQK